MILLVKETREKGRGIFAKKAIEKGMIIGDYLGKIIHPRDAEINDENFYLMYYHDEAVIVPDLNQPGVHFWKCFLGQTPGCGLCRYIKTR